MSFVIHLGLDSTADLLRLGLNPGLEGRRGKEHLLGGMSPMPSLDEGQAAGDLEGSALPLGYRRDAGRGGERAFSRRTSGGVGKVVPQVGLDRNCAIDHGARVQVGRHLHDTELRGFILCRASHSPPEITVPGLLGLLTLGIRGPRINHIGGVSTELNLRRRLRKVCKGACRT